MRPVVYISGPISLGNRNLNYFHACEAERQLMLSGFAPINPIRSMVLPFAWDSDMPHDLWLEVDLPIIERVDAVLRIPGESVGADREVGHALTLGIPVYYDIDLLEAELETIRSDAQIRVKSLQAKALEPL